MCAYFIVHIMKILNKFLLETQNNKNINKNPSLIIKNPHNFSDLSEINNIFIEKSTLIKEKEIKIKGLFLEKTFYYYENLKKKELMESVLHMMDHSLHKTFSKNFSQECFDKNTFIDHCLKSKKLCISESVNENSSHSNKKSLSFLREKEKSSSVLFNTKQKSIQTINKPNAPNAPNKHLIDSQHFSDLFANEDLHKNLYDILQVLVLCHFTKSKIDKNSSEMIYEHMNPEDQAIFEFASMHDASFESFLVAPKNNIKCFQIKIRGVLQIFPILGVNEFTEVRNRFSIVLHNPMEDNAFLLIRGNHHSFLEILEMSEFDKCNLKRFLESMNILGYRYIIYARKELDMDETSAYIQKYNICKTSLTIEQNELNKFYLEIENNSKLVTILFLKDKLITGFLSFLFLFLNFN